MDIFREWIKDDTEGILNRLNTSIFMQDWNKYAKGNISSWEMEALCFYYHKHELADLNQEKFGLEDFFSLPTSPVVDRVFRKGNKEIKLFKLSKICGTCIAKNKAKSTVTLLTVNGVVEVKFNKEHFAMFDKQISRRNEDGTKSIIEKSWFNRGNMIIVMGIRSDDTFIVKKYNNILGHRLYKIDKIINNDEIILKSERLKGEEEESED